MKFEEQYIKGVWLIKPERHGDARGYFCESFKKAEFENAVGHVEFVQDNESMSSRGVLRGLHFQRGEFSQAKLVRVSQGRVLDVAVDIRNFAHGFLVLSDMAQFQYKVDNVYAPQAEATLRFDDPALGIKWPTEGMQLNLSEKDKKGMTLDEIKLNIAK